MSALWQTLRHSENGPNGSLETETVKIQVRIDYYEKSEGATTTPLQESTSILYEVSMSR